MKVLRSILWGMAAVALVCVAASALPLADEHKVDITDTGFVPMKVDVKVGETVLWKNTTEKEHSVTADDKSGGNADDKPLFDSGPIKPGAVYQHTFDQAGTIGYHCSSHKEMKGSVVVK